jgi:hypothetical protein
VTKDELEGKHAKFTNPVEMATLLATADSTATF